MHTRTVFLLTLLLSVVLTGQGTASPKAIRPLQEIGIFRVSAMWRVANGELIQSTIEPFDYRVLSNGERIELELVGADDKRLSYQVYKAGTRMIVEESLNGVATAEAILASSRDGGTLRQVLLTPQLLRITRMPVNSLDIIVIEAEKIESSSDN